MKAKATKQIKGSLYGIRHSNRPGAELRGKNQFNSTFPADLACYMRDRGIPCVYLALKSNSSVAVSDLPIGVVFNTDLPNDELRFEFEHRFQPYQQNALDRNSVGIRL